MAEDNDRNQSMERLEEEDASNLLDLLLIFVRHKKKILIIPFLIGCAVAVYSLQVPEIFSAYTTLIPSDQKKSGAVAMLGQLGPIPPFIAGGAGAGSETELLATMVESRRIQDKIIAKRNLQTVNGESITMAAARLDLSKATNVSIGMRDGVIMIVVENESPKKAAQLANDYVLELENLTRELALTGASQRRIFLEKQLADAIDALQLAEEGLKSSQQKSGLIQLDTQAQATITAVAELQAEIAAKEVALGALRLSGTEENPDVQRLLTAIQKMQSQLALMEKAQPGNQAINSVIMSTSKIPAAGLEYLRRVRNLKYAETIHQLLAQQYQMAKVDEARDAPLLQVLDVAIPPEKRSRPKRTQMVLMAMVPSGFAMCLLAFLLEAKRKAEEDPEQSEKVADLKKSLCRF